MPRLLCFCATNRKATLVNVLQNFHAGILCMYKWESIFLCYIVSFGILYNLFFSFFLSSIFFQLFTNLYECMCVFTCYWVLGMQALSSVWRSEDSTWKLMLWCYSVSKLRDQTQVIEPAFKYLYSLSHYTAPKFICLWVLYSQPAVQHSILWLCYNSFISVFIF